MWNTTKLTLKFSATFKHFLDILWIFFSIADLQTVNGRDGAGSSSHELIVVALVALRVHLRQTPKKSTGQGWWCSREILGQDAWYSFLHGHKTEYACLESNQYWTKSSKFHKNHVTFKSTCLLRYYDPSYNPTKQGFWSLLTSRWPMSGEPDHDHGCHRSRRYPFRKGSCPWRQEGILKQSTVLHQISLRIALVKHIWTYGIIWMDIPKLADVKEQLKMVDFTTCRNHL